MSKTEKVLNIKSGKMENCTVGAGCTRHAHSLDSLSSEAIANLADRITPKDYYFIFHQNNSGGSFIEPAQNVIVKASSVKEANQKFLDAGGYFDPSFERDCSCCGERWNEMEEYVLERADLMDHYSVFSTKDKAINSVTTFGNEVEAYIVVE